MQPETWLLVVLVAGVAVALCVAVIFYLFPPEDQDDD